MEFTKRQPKHGYFPIDSSVTETFCAVELCDAISLSLIQVKSLKSGYSIRDEQSSVDGVAGSSLKLASQLTGLSKRFDSRSVSGPAFKGILASGWIRGKCSV